VTKSFLFCLCEESALFIFNTQTSEIMKCLKLKNSYKGMMHPLTYLNKLVLWHKNNLVLHNVIEDEVIFEFKPFTGDIDAVVQSPVLNVVAVGC